MIKQALLCTLAMIAGLTTAAPAQARCRLPVLTTPEAAAEHLLATTDLVGFAVVRRSEGAEARRPELVDVLFPIKGRSGPVEMGLWMEADAIVVTNHATSFGVAEGTMVFAALTATPRGAVISECTAALMHQVGKDQLIKARTELDSPGLGRR